MMRMMTLGFGLLFSVSAFASNNVITCQRMANIDAVTNACFEEVNREAALLDIQLLDDAALSPDGESNVILVAQVQVGSNACDASGLTAVLEPSVGENGESILVARVKGTKELGRACTREYAPVYQEVSFNLADLNEAAAETIIKNAEAPGALQAVESL